jgi:hypothetical protein
MSSSSASRAWYTTLFGVVLLVVRAIWRVIGPVLTTVSAAGWIVLLAAVAAFIGGRILAWQELVYLSITLGAGFVCAIGFIFGRGVYSVDIELTPRRVVAGGRALGRLVVRNPSRRNSSPSRLELPVGVGLAEFVIPSLAPDAEHEELFAVPTSHRAVIVAGPAESVRGDQLGLLRRTVRWADPIELFVHPVTTPLTPSAAGLVRDLEGQVTKTITNSDISFHALRAYEPGDDRRYVHWRTSARTGQLMVRQFEETRRSDLTVLFASDARHYASDDEFELAVSVLASLGVQVIRDGTRVNIVTESIQLSTRTVNSLLDDSCRIETTPNLFGSARDFARARTSKLPAPSVVMIVTGSRFPLADFRTIDNLFGVDAKTVGFRAEMTAVPQVTANSSLRIATVGDLRDLNRLVRRAT